MQKFKTYKGEIQKALVRFIEMKTPHNVWCETDETKKKFSIELFKNEKLDVTVGAILCRNSFNVCVFYDEYTEQFGWVLRPLLKFEVCANDDDTISKCEYMGHERKAPLCSELARLVKVCRMIHGKYKGENGADHRHGEA